jgi:hypothetical protein
VSRFVIPVRLPYPVPRKLRHFAARPARERKSQAQHTV